MEHDCIIVWGSDRSPRYLDSGTERARLLVGAPNTRTEHWTSIAEALLASEKRAANGRPLGRIDPNQAERLGFSVEREQWARERIRALLASNPDPTREQAADCLR